MESKSDLLQGTLDMLILKIVALGPVHGYAIAQRIRQISKEVLQVQAGVVLSGAAPAGEAGMATRRVGRSGNRAQGQVLCTHEAWPPATGSRGGKLRPAVES